MQYFLFLVLLSLLELISSMFRTLTLPNRLSVNLFAGIMIVNVVSINSSNFSIIGVLICLIGLVIMIYELLNLILFLFLDTIFRKWVVLGGKKAPAGALKTNIGLFGGKKRPLRER